MRCILLMSTIGLACSCGSYTENIMFKTSAEFAPEKITKEALKVTEGYTLQKNDHLYVNVFSNKGERIVEPYPELERGVLVQERQRINYVVSTAGTVRLPVIGEIALEGLTRYRAEKKVQQAYQKFFEEPYVSIHLRSKRVILLGGMEGQVIPLKHQNTRLTEILALGKGLPKGAKANSIKVLRNDKVFLIDMSTLEGYAEGDIIMQSGDIIYVEPARRPVREWLKDYSGFVNLLTSLASLIIVIVSLNR